MIEVLKDSEVTVLWRHAFPLLQPPLLAGFHPLKKLLNVSL